jgi:hypothetical protein
MCLLNELSVNYGDETQVLTMKIIAVVLIFDDDVYFEGFFLLNSLTVKI